LRTDFLHTAKTAGQILSHGRGFDGWFRRNYSPFAGIIPLTDEKHAIMACIPELNRQSPDGAAPQGFPEPGSILPTEADGAYMQAQAD
jgi:hypothetical protein